MSETESRAAHARNGLLPNRLYPEVIYRLNDTLLRWWMQNQLGKIDGKKDVYFSASFFSSHSRTFHWVSMYPDLWSLKQGTPTREVLLTLVEKLRSYTTDDANLGQDPEGSPPDQGSSDGSKGTESSPVDQLLADLPPGHFYEAVAATLHQALQLGPDFPREKSESLHRAILAMYSGFHHARNRNVEGVFVRLLESFGLQGDEDATSPLTCLHGSLRASTGPADWFDVDDDICEYEFTAGTKLCNKFHKYQFVRDPQRNCHEEPTGDEPLQKTALQRLMEEVFFTGLLGERGGSQGSFQDALAVRQAVALLPIYEVSHRDQGFGRLHGVLLCFFRDPELREDWLAKNKAALSSGLTRIAADVAVSAQTLAAAAEIRPPYDLLRHFLSVLHFVQDWEAAWVFDTAAAGKTGTALKYRFVRSPPEGGSVKWGWQFESANEDEMSLEGTIGENIFRHRDRWFLWWTNGHAGTINLWKPEFIPELNQDEEAARFDRYAICFEFPNACRMPPEGSAASIRMREVYLGQQLSLMGVLLQKVRARRAALRSAVSAIMGRNMSHNIGSHVLARYSVGISRDLEDPPTGKADHRTEFLSYLQRRMDFLAEVATSDRAHWSQALSLKQQLGRLNWEAQNERYGFQLGATGKDKKPVLLSYITGKDAIASVDYDKDTVDILFDCPGGEVGVHALFIILENIIRNSARHSGASSQSGVRIRVEVDKDESKGGLIQILILDPGTKLDTSGRPPKKPRDGESRSLIDEINKTLELKVPILTESGAPHERNWGVREIQICSHYLVGNSLKDLEGDLSVVWENGSSGSRVVEAFCGTSGGSTCLGYRIWLRRPKLLAVAVKANGLNNDLCSLSSEDLGVRVLAIEPTGDTASRLKQFEGYSYLLLDEGVSPPDGNDACLPARTLAGVSSANIQEAVKAATSQGSSSLMWLGLLHRELAAQVIRSWEPGMTRLVAVALHNGELGEAIRAPIQPDSLQPVDFPVGLSGHWSGNWGPISRHMQQDPPSNSGEAATYPFGADLSKELSNALSREDTLALAWLDHPRENVLSFKPEYSYNLKPRATQWASVEVAYSGTPHAEVLAGEFGDTGAWELIAASLSQVAVLDERVQAESGEKFRTLYLPELWAAMGIHVPSDTTCNLNEPDREAFQRFLSSKPKGGRYHYAVVHLTLLESPKLRSHGSTPFEVFKALVEGTAAEGAQLIVVTGRGVQLGRMAASSGSITFRYLPISAVLEYLVGRPSKLGLMRALWSSRGAG